MKFLVFYFSGTGNTKWAVNELKNSILKKGHECEICSVEYETTNLGELVNGADIIGFAFPVYGANIPIIMKRHIEKFKDILITTGGKPSFILTTGGYIDGYGPFCAARLLKNNGFKLIGYINLKMSNNISTPKIKASFLESNEMKIRMDKGRKKIEKLTNRVIDKKRYIRNIGFYLIPGMVIRRVTEKAKENNYLSLSISQEKCSQCMLCVKNCPTKSIVFTEDKFEFLPSCTACMRCYNFCPAYAICHEGKYADPKVYMRYRGPQSIL